MDHESEQKPLLSNPQKEDDDGGTAATYFAKFCEGFRNPSSRRHRMIILLLMCFVNIGKLPATNCYKK